MITWKFNPADYNPDRFELVPPGKYRVRIEEAEETASKSGYPMVKMRLKVSGFNGGVWHYMVFMGGQSRTSEADERQSRPYL